MHHDLEVFSAAHGFYNQSPELANFLRSHFLSGEDVDRSTLVELAAWRGDGAVAF